MPRKYIASNILSTEHNIGIFPSPRCSIPRSRFWPPSAFPWNPEIDIPGMCTASTSPPPTAACTSSTCVGIKLCKLPPAFAPFAIGAHMQYYKWLGCTDRRALLRVRASACAVYSPHTVPLALFPLYLPPQSTHVHAGRLRSSPASPSPSGSLALERVWSKINWGIVWPRWCSE